MDDPAELGFPPDAAAAPPGEGYDVDIEAAYLRALEAVTGLELEAPTDAPPVSAQEDPPQVAPVVEAPPPVRAQAAQAPPVGLAQVVEAALFVGGRPLTSKALAGLVGGTTEAAQIDETLDGLNADYAGRGCPYEIRLVEGGYVLALRSEYEAVRNRVYGIGPRDVKLSQDVLEVLALIAYKQPVSHDALERCGQPGATGHVRQLLRRELVAMHRLGPQRHAVEYRTTARFLSLFGLGSLRDLPQPEDLGRR